VIGAILIVVVILMLLGRHVERLAFLSSLSAEGCAAVCLSYFDADLSTAGARFAVRRLRWRLGEVKILAEFWRSGSGQASELCAATEADLCATRSKEALAFCLPGAVGEEDGGPGKIGA
jgi:hypothetical protein